MPRPSQQVDQALLASGRQLYAQAGCRGLSLRAVAEHAGVNPGMFHYHFRTKDNFLRTLLLQMYEEMFAALTLDAAQGDTAMQRLRAALTTLARFARQHRLVLARVWMDALAGEAVARDFLHGNAPRHIRPLFGLLEQAQAEGALRELPPVQRAVFVLGSLLLPMVFASGLLESGLAPPRVRRAFDDQVMGDAAIEQRIELALAALCHTPAPGPTPRRAARARRTPRAKGEPQ